MADSEKPTPELEIKSDAEWKERVKAEDARRDAERAQQQQAKESKTEQSPPPIDPDQLPKPQFATLVGLFSTQAMVSLGLIGHPEDGKVEVQLPLARHFIDLLGVLEDKTQGNLTNEEAALLEQTLHDLRLAYVERSRDG